MCRLAGRAPGQRQRALLLLLGRAPCLPALWQVWGARGAPRKPGPTCDGASAQPPACRRHHVARFLEVDDGILVVVGVVQVDGNALAALEDGVIGPCNSGHAPGFTTVLDPAISREATRGERHACKMPGPCLGGIVNPASAISKVSWRYGWMVSAYRMQRCDCYQGLTQIVPPLRQVRHQRAGGVCIAARRQLLGCAIQHAGRGVVAPAAWVVIPTPIRGEPA